MLKIFPLCAATLLAAPALAEDGSRERPGGAAPANRAPSGSDGQLFLPPTTTTIRRPAPPPKTALSDLWLGPSVGLGFPRLATVGFDVKYRDWFKVSAEYGTIPGDYPFRNSSWSVGAGWFFVPKAHLSLAYGNQKSSFTKTASGTHPLGGGAMQAFDVERKVSHEADFLTASLGYFAPLAPFLFFECEIGWQQPVRSSTSISTDEGRIPADFTNADDMRRTLRDADTVIGDYVKGGKPYVTLTRLHFLF